MTTLSLTHLQHENYDAPDFDVALLTIDGEVDADGVNVDFAVLAETDAEDFVGNDCEIAGWGQTESEQHTAPYIFVTSLFFRSQNFMAVSRNSPCLKRAL